MLTPRQERILSTVVDVHVETGQPVPSRAIAGNPGLDCGSSTVRNELALLEEQGLVTHPHTSAGRVPTDAGRRYVVDMMLATGPRAWSAPGLELSLARREVEQAMRATTEALSQVTSLLAVVSSPPLDVATVRHVEVLALQPQVVAVVVINSAGGVSKMLTAFDHPVDPGLVKWAGQYLNERLSGMDLGARMLHQRLLDPGVGEMERAFLERIALPLLDEIPSEAGSHLYFDGTSHLLSAGQFESVGEVNELMHLLEQRVALLSVLRTALAAPGIYVRIGGENELPAMRSLSLVAAAYGFAQRKLGAVSVIGSVRMDYASAIGTVHEAAQELSRFVEDAYAGI